MIYNIDSVRVLSRATLSIHVSAVLRLAEAHSDLPETCFLHDAEMRAQKMLREASPNFTEHVLVLDRLDWSGVASGATFDTFKTALAATRGRADLLLTWEGGDRLSGLRVVDGIVTEMDVDFILVEKRK